MVLGKKVAIFDWELGRNSAPRDGQKVPCNCVCKLLLYSYRLVKKCVLSDQKHVFWLRNKKILGEFSVRHSYLEVYLSCIYSQGQVQDFWKGGRGQKYFNISLVLQDE